MGGVAKGRRRKENLSKVKVKRITGLWGEGPLPDRSPVGVDISKSQKKNAKKNCTCSAAALAGRAVATWRARRRRRGPNASAWRRTSSRWGLRDNSSDISRFAGSPSSPSPPAPGPAAAAAGVAGSVDELLVLRPDEGVDGDEKEGEERPGAGECGAEGRAPEIERRERSPRGGSPEGEESSLETPAE
jgi:hypothetical protein